MQAGDVWMQDRNFCPWGLLCGMDTRGAFFLTRQPQALPYAMVTPLREAGRVETGQVAEPRVRVSDAAGHAHLCRRLRVKLKHPTRDGARLLSILTNLPRKTFSALTVARLYRQRPLIIVMALFSI